MAREQAEARRTYAARCAVAQAHQPGAPGSVPLPTVEQSAAMNLAPAGDEVAERWRHNPPEAIDLVRELRAGGELSPGEVLDAAVDAAVLTGLLALQQVRTAPDPSTMAERCPGAAPHLALAVALASADLD